MHALQQHLIVLLIRTQCTVHSEAAAGVASVVSRFLFNEGHAVLEGQTKCAEIKSWHTCKLHERVYEEERAVEVVEHLLTLFTENI